VNGLLENNIKILYKDGHPLELYDTISQSTSADIYVPLKNVEKGDKLTLVTQNDDNISDSYRDSVFLSPNEKRLFKNIVIEAEIEFVREDSNPNQWIEFIVRGVNIWDKTYTIDECYIFGYKNGDFYFGKRGYHEEGEQSYAYKQLFDLTAVGDDTRRYFIPISDEQKKELQIFQDKLDYNEKYIFRCELIDEIAKFQIKNVSKTLSQFQTYKWITIFENVTVRQTVDDITNVTMDLEGSVSVMEPFSVLQQEGVFGFSVSNSHVKMYRFLAENKDQNKPLDLYTDEEFSREVSTEFALTFNEFKEVKLNAVIPGRELGDVVEEHFAIEGTRIPISTPVNKEDIKSIEIGNVEVTAEEIFETEKIVIKQSLSRDHEGGKISAFFDLDQREHYGQKEVYLELAYETNGISDTYDLPDELFYILENYPNAKMDDVIIEIDSNIVSNNVDRVGVKEDLSKFIDRHKLNELINGRKFYMATDIRGTKTTIEMGQMSPNNFMFNIQEQYLRPSPSYEALWNYNTSNFCNQLLVDYATYIVPVTNGQVYQMWNDDGVMINGGISTDELKHIYINKYAYTLGEAVIELPQELFDYILTNRINREFVVGDSNIDSVIKEYLIKGVPEDMIKIICEFAEMHNSITSEIRDIIKYAKLKNTVFDSYITDFMAKYGSVGYTPYLNFRKYWLRDFEFNMVISDSGSANRKFFQSLYKDVEYHIEGKQLIFDKVPKVSKVMQVRVFYDLTYELTNSYSQTITEFNVPDAIKKISNDTKHEKGIKQLVEFMDLKQVDIQIKNNIPFVVIPKKLNEFNDELYIDLNYCVPYVSDQDSVIKKGKFPLRKIKQLLYNDFENSKYGEIYPYTQDNPIETLPVYSVVIGSSTLDISEAYTYDFNNEIERECFIANVSSGFSDIDELVAIQNSLRIFDIYTSDVSRKKYDEWDRHFDVLDTRSETVSGYWQQIYIPELLPFYGTSIPIILADTIFGDIVEGISGVSTSLAETMGISGIANFPYITVDAEGRLVYTYQYPRFYPQEDGYFGAEINKHFLYDENYQLEFENYGYKVPVIDIDITKSYVKYNSTIFNKDSKRNMNPYMKLYKNLDDNDQSYLPRTEIMDKFYRVGDWMNFNNSKLGDYYQKVLKTIVDVKTNNRYEGQKKTLTENASPFNLNNWFEGYYTGERAPFYDLFSIPTHRFEITEDGLINVKSPSNQDSLVFSTGGQAYVKGQKNSYIFNLDLGNYEGITSTEWSIGGSIHMDVYGNNTGSLTEHEFLFTMYLGSYCIPTRYKYRYFIFYSGSGGSVSSSVELRVDYIKFYRDNFDISKLNPDYIHFGRYYGNPWGTQNSRKQMIEQTRQSIDNKFEEYDLYYADLTQLFYPEKRAELGLDYNYWDTSLYPNKFCASRHTIADEEEFGVANTNTELYIRNPYVDDKLQLYKFNRDVVVNGQLVFKNSDLSDVTDTKKIYKKQNAFAVDIDTTVLTINGITRHLVKGRDAMWLYDSYMTIRSTVLQYLAIGSVISVEYEYTMNFVTENANTPTRISQRVVLGRVNGSDKQVFMNPLLAMRQENITHFNLHRMWIDNIQVSKFDIVQVGDGQYEIEMDLPEIFKRKKQVGLIYRNDNHLTLREKNKFLQKFDSNDQVPWFWVPFSRDKNGYIKKSNNFTTFVVDDNKYENDLVFHINNVSVDEIKTTATSFGGELIKPIQYGRDDEDIIQLNTIKRKNNFVLGFDFIYDTDIERELMRFDVIFKGQFVAIDGVQQLCNYYALVFGLDKGISLISRRLSSNSIIEEVVLAQIQDIGGILKRGKFYSVKIEVIKNQVKVYFNERGQNPKFFVGTNLQLGHESNYVEMVAEDKYGDLNVIYKNPTYFIDGNRFALKTSTPKVNFTNFAIEFLDPSNLTFGNPFVIENYDSIVSNLKTKFGITGDLVSIKKLTTGYEYVQIGDSMLSRRIDGNFVLHNMVVEKFEVVEDKCFIQEKVNSDSPMTVINVYEQGFKLIQNIVVNGKQLGDESFISFLAESNKKAINIEKVDGKLFITIGDITQEQFDSEQDLTWDQLNATWQEYYAPWNLF